jgi:hypothetical protein
MATSHEVIHLADSPKRPTRFNPWGFILAGVVLVLVLSLLWSRSAAAPSGTRVAPIDSPVR